MKKKITGLLTAIMCAVSAAGITQSPIASAESFDDGWYEYKDDPDYTYDGDYL